MVYLRYSVMLRNLALFFSLFLLSFFSRASHVAGGDITWTCQGGAYVFQLAFYHDCNGSAPLNSSNETIEVWGHPTISVIQLDFVSSTEITPTCTEVAGGPQAISCGPNGNSATGVGAIIKVIYQSQPIVLTGTPPASGWIFTYQNFARSSTITNLIDPGISGLTLVSKMFEAPGAAAGTCVDNSPQFLQDPHFASCAGDPYSYNMNAVDPDLDSMRVVFSEALNWFNGQTYNPPTAPAAMIYETGFSANSPTPGTGLNPGNIPAQIDASSGELTFLSNTAGTFLVKVTVQSYRNNVLIAEVDREMQIVVQNCAGTNNPPVVAGPFGGLFETTVDAGTLVNFTLNATDVELLQDGSPQNNSLSASGLLFGTNYTSNSGCAIAPCATLNATPLITMPQGVSTDFSWQTDCAHLTTPLGINKTTIPYHFVFKIQDDYCPIPKVTYATITINVRDPGVVGAPSIDCIQSDAAGNTTINWTPVVDPFGTFNEYQIYSVQSGLLGSEPNIGGNTFTFTSAGQEEDYYIAVASGCNGTTLSNSDTVKNIFLDVINPTNGTAVLQWNDPTTPATSGMNDFYHIYREYPAGIWSLYDSVAYGTNFYVDTIDICDVFLNYQIVLPNSPCDFISNIDGDQFEDMITPDIPLIDFVTIDTLTGNVILTWNENSQPDTYGYVIYTEDANGFIVEIDTVWGIGNTTYTHSTNTDNGSLIYSVAAFDSCYTPATPPTFQTSAKAELHRTTFIQSSLDICSKTVSLTWNEYEGWSGIDHYEIYARIDGGSWSNIGSSPTNSFQLSVIENSNYCFVVEAVSDEGVRAFSNISCIYIEAPQSPAYNYLTVATVTNEAVVLRHVIDNSVFISELSVQRLNDDGVFEEIARIPGGSATNTYTDTEVDVYSSSYTYRIQVIDSCNLEADASNVARTILLDIVNDEVAKVNYLSWNSYQDFDGSVLGYRIYRGVDGVFANPPLATLSSNIRAYEDTVNAVVSSGEICYLVEAIEATNTFSFAEVSRSNERCIVLPPLIYIPNAFYPDGINKVFRPVISDFDASRYEMIIYDRYGRPIFETNDYTAGWTGEISASGNMAMPGVYVYLITVTDVNGVEIVKRGHVSLLK